MGSVRLSDWRKDRPPVAVGIPLGWSQARTSFVQFAHLFKGMRDDDHLLLNANVAVPAAARNWLIQEFLKLPKTVRYLLLFDDDMVVPPGTIERLTLHGQPFVSGLCTLKAHPFTPTAYYTVPITPQVVPGHEFYGVAHHDYKPLVNLPTSGVAKVDAVGAACLCLRRDLLEALDAPWFKDGEGSGEDLYFCRKATDAGYRVLVDTSVRPGHVGEHVATYDDFRDVWAKREAAGEVAGVPYREVAADVAAGA